MLAIQKLLFKTWLRSPGPFFSFIFPLVLLLILGIVFPSPVNVLLPGIIASGATALGASSMAISVVSFRNSVILKRIAITPLRKSDFIIGVVIFYVMVAICMVFFITGVAVALYGDFDKTHTREWIQNTLIPTIKQNKSAGADTNDLCDAGTTDKCLPINIQKFYINAVDWPAYILGSFVNIVFAISIGAFVIGLAKNTEKAIILGILFILPGSLLTGRFAPVSTIDSVNVIAIISRILPLRYSSNLMINPCTYLLQATNNVANNAPINSAWTDAEINYPVTIGSTILFTGFGIWKFKWEK